MTSPITIPLPIRDHTSIDSRRSHVGGAGIYPADSPEPLPPQIPPRTVGGKLEVIWIKQGMEAVEIHNKSGTGWQFVTNDTRPNYFDTTPFPATAAKWKYRAIYTADSHKFGQWSPVVEITVGG